MLVAQLRAQGVQPFRGRCISSMVRYRHVYRRSGTRWEIRHPEHGRIHRDVAGKPFSSQVVAAKHLAKLLHVNIAMLNTTSGVQVSRSPRRFKYVSWHVGRSRWVAKPPGCRMTTSDESGSCFTSQDHAARFVVKQLGLSSVKDLSILKRPRLQESRSPGVRQYMYVFWHSRMEKWVARPPQGRMTSCGCDGAPFKSQVDAAKFVVQKQGLKSIDDLKLKKSSSPGVEKVVSQYHGVVRHRMRWSAIVEQRTLGTFNLQVEAADAIAKELGCSRQHLVREKQSRLRPGQMLCRLRSAGKIFQGLLPGDLESMQCFATGAARAMLKAAPVLIIMLLQGKYGPWHEALTKAWRKCGRPSFSAAKCLCVQESTSPGVMEHAESLKDVLVEAAKLMHMVDLKVWITNCGKNVSHHSGPAPLLMRCDIVDSINDPQSSTSPGVQGDELKIGDSWYRLRPDTQESRSSGATPKIAMLIAASHAWIPAWVKPPSSMAEWKCQMYAIIEQLSKCKAPGLQPHISKKSRSPGIASYLVVWTMRALFLTSMHVHGICCLKLEASTSIADLMGCFPDQSDWVSKLAKATGTTSVSGLLEAVGYTGPVELFTCYCCFLGDPDFDWVTSDWLASHSRKLKAAITAYRAEHGQNPNPAVILKVVAGIKPT